MAALCSGGIVPGARSFAKLLVPQRGSGGKTMAGHIGNTNSGPHTSGAVSRLLVSSSPGSAVKPRGGACRKLKKTLRALESKFSRGTNIINHQFWVSSEEQHPWRRAHTLVGCRVLFKRGWNGDGRSGRERRRARKSGEREKRERRSRRTAGREREGRDR